MYGQSSVLNCRLQFIYFYFLKNQAKEISKTSFNFFDGMAFPITLTV